MRPARLAEDIREPLDWLAGLISAGDGLSLETLKQEFLKVMHAIDTVAVTSDLHKDHADSALVFKLAEPVEKKKNSVQLPHKQK